jgi:TRAP-type transport system small permease protein
MLHRILDVYARILKTLLIILMFTLLIAVALQILGRYVPFIPRFLWTVEVSNFSLIWAILLGSVVGVKEGRHFYVDFLPKELSPALHRGTRIAYYFFMFGLTFVFVFYGFQFFKMGYIQESEFTGLNLGTIYISVPVAGTSWLFFLIDNIIEEFVHGRIPVVEEEEELL